MNAPLKYQVVTPDGATIYAGGSMRDALRAARRELGVRRLVHDDQRRPTGGGTYWLHADSTEGCASVELHEYR